MRDKILLLRGEKKDLPELMTAEPAFCVDTKELVIGCNGTNVIFPTPQRTTVLEEKVAVLEQGSADLSSKVSANTASIQNIATAVQDNKTTIQKNTAEITVNAGNIAKNTGDIGNLKLSQQDQDTKITALETGASDIEDRVTKLEESNNVVDGGTFAEYGNVAREVK